LFPDSASRENLLPEFNGKLRRSQLQVAEGFFHFLVMLRITRQISLVAAALHQLVNDRRTDTLPAFLTLLFSAGKVWQSPTATKA
jgi:hypothetical protein